MASEQSTHLETFVHVHTIFDYLFRPILVEPTTFLHLSSSSDTIIGTKAEDSRARGERVEGQPHLRG